MHRNNLMVERKFQTLFLNWLRHQSKLGTAVFELKLTKEGSLPFTALREHQFQALQSSKHRRLAYKIADDSVGFKPFDCFQMRGVPAYVVISFYTRGTKKFYMIDVDAWEEEWKASKRKSLTEKRAGEIGYTCLLNVDGCEPPKVGSHHD